MGVILRVAATAPVAGADVEVAVRPKHRAATVVVGVGLPEGEQNRFRGRVNLRGIHRRCFEAADHRFARMAIAFAGVVDVKEAVLLEIRVKRQAKQTHFATVGYLLLNIEIGGGRCGVGSLIDQFDAARLLQHKHTVGAVGRVRVEYGRVECQARMGIDYPDRS